MGHVCKNFQREGGYEHFNWMFETGGYHLLFDEPMNLNKENFYLSLDLASTIERLMKREWKGLEMVVMVVEDDGDRQ